MAGIQIPVPQPNGDSESGTGFNTQPITVEQIDYNKDALLQKLWEDKAGKVDSSNRLGLYVEIPQTGVIDLNKFAAEMLKTLLDEYYSLLWARNFGRVAVGISDRSATMCTQFALLEKDDKKAKSFQLIQGGILISPKEVILQPSTERGLNLITLNNQPTSIDGALITLIHLIDQLVWQRARIIQGGDPNYDSYKRAVQLILEEGIALEFKTEDEILIDYLILPQERMVRLYGSKNTSVPFVLGYVQNNALQNCCPLDASAKEVFAENVEKLQPEVQTFEVVLGITTAKKIHMGHILMYLLADSFAQIYGFSITTVANNTGPRVAQTISILQKYLKESEGVELSFEEARQALSQMPLSQVDQLYRSRTSETTQEEISSLLSSSDLPTLQLATLENLQRVASLGINTALSFDTQRDIRSVLEFFFKDKLGFLPNLGIGFVKLSTGQSLVYMSNGMLTAQGMTLINVINRFVDSNYQKGILYVDGSYPTVLGVRIAREILGIPAINIAGAAIGFNGEIASGSNGNSISIEEIIALSTKVSVQLEISYEASLTLVKRVLTRMLFSMQYISTLHPGDPAAEPFYDFKDKKSFERFVMQSAFECITSDRKIDLVVKYLEGSITDFQGGEGVVKKELIGKLHAIPTMKPDTILRRISVQKIQPPQKINADMFKICGYDDLESEVLASKAKSGEIFICRRSHPFMDFVIMLLSLNKRDLDSLSPEEKETLKQAILIVKRIF